MALTFMRNMYLTSRNKALTGNSLYFYYMSRGKILSSRKPEKYTTFLELGNRPRVANSDQLSDQWLVNKLYQHYYMINRRHQSIFWDLVLLKTIGFATFIRV